MALGFTGAGEALAGFGAAAVALPVAAAPGAREMITIAKVFELAQLERWDRHHRTYDLVIVDEQYTNRHKVTVRRGTTARRSGEPSDTSSPSFTFDSSTSRQLINRPRSGGVHSDRSTAHKLSPGLSTAVDIFA